MPMLISWGKSSSGANVLLPFEGNSVLSSNSVIINDGADDDVSLTANMFPATSDTVLLLRMNESSWSGARSEVRDSSGKRHHGSAIGGASTTSGWQDLAGSFDGNLKRVSIPHHSDIDLQGEYFLMEAMIKRVGNGTSTSEYIVHKEKLTSPYGGFSWYIDRTSKRMRFRIVDENGNISLYSSTSISQISDNVWTHVWVSYDSNSPFTVKFGIDDEVETALPVGVDIGDIPIVTATVNSESYPKPLYVGGKDVDGSGFNGLIDEVRFLLKPYGGIDDISYSAGEDFPRYSTGTLITEASLIQDVILTAVSIECSSIGTGYGTIKVYAYDGGWVAIGSSSYSASPIYIPGLSKDIVSGAKTPIIKVEIIPEDVVSSDTDSPIVSSIVVTLTTPEVTDSPGGPLLFPGGFWGNSMLLLYSPKTDDHPAIETTDGVMSNCIYCTDFEMGPKQEADTEDGKIAGHPDRLTWSTQGIEVRGRISQKMLAMNDGSPDFMLARIYEHCRHTWAGYQYAFPSDYGGGVQGIPPSVYVPQFSIMSDIHGVFSNCQVDSMEFVAEANEQVEVNYDIVAQKLWPEEALNVRNLFSSMVMDMGHYSLMRQVFSHDCGITAAGSVTNPIRSTFDLPSSGSNPLLDGYNISTTPPNERLVRMSLKIENFMEPNFTMQSHRRWATQEERDLHAYERFRDNMWPRSWFNSKPRLISGEIVWITDAFPMEIFSRVVGVPSNQIFAPTGGTQLGQPLMMAFGPIWIRITNPVWSVPTPDITPDNLFKLKVNFVGASDGDLVLLPTEDWTRDILDERPVYQQIGD